MNETFGLKRSTANRILNKLRESAKGGAGVTKGRGTSRFDIHVKVTGPSVDGLSPCITTDYDCSVGAWNEYTEECLCFGPNDEVLTEDKRYRAINYGMIEGVLIFCVDANNPEVDCYHYYDDGKLKLDPYALAGQGLIVEDDSDSETCDPIKVDIDECTLEFVGNKVAVRLEDLAGCGLTTELVPDDSDSDSDDGPCYRFAVDVPELVGEGLQVDDDGPCDKIKFPLDQFTGPTFDAVTSITADGCGLTYEVTTFTVKVNADGVFLDLEAGEPVENAVDLSACCDCGGGGEGCDYPGPLTATVTPSECTPVVFTLELEEGAWTGSEAMGGCACPETPVELWTLSLTCSEGVFTVVLSAPTGDTTLTNPMTVVDDDPLHLTTTGTITCGETILSVDIEITE